VICYNLFWHKTYTIIPPTTLCILHRDMKPWHVEYHIPCV